MSFDEFDVKHESTGENNVDFQEVNKYKLKAFGDKPVRSIVGIISSIISLGTQKQEDAAMEWTGTDEEQAGEIEKNPDTYFEVMENNQGKEVMHKRWPQKPYKAVAITVDFPQITMDLGQFFGESNPAPMRMILNREWLFNKVDGEGKEMRLNRNYVMKETTKDFGVFSLQKSNPVYKMADAAGVLNEDNTFHPKDIDRLLGVALQFEVKVSPFIKGDKTYVNEKIKFLGAPAEGVAVPELDPSLLSIVQFTKESSEENLRVLRRSIKNTIRLALDYDGSVLQGQLDGPSEANNSSSGDSSGEGVAEGGSDGTSSDEPTGASQGVPDESWNEEDDTPF